MRMLTILTDKEFNKLYPKWLDQDKNHKFNKFPKEKFIVIEEHKERNIYTVIDNTSGDAWCEDFIKLNKALEYAGVK